MTLVFRAVPRIPRRDGGVLPRDMAQAGAMPMPDAPPPARSPLGVGGPFVLALIAGVVIGLIAGQPTIGFLAGAGLGAAIAALIWWRDRA